MGRTYNMLQVIYGKDNIAETVDDGFLIINCGELMEVVVGKETRKKNYSPSQKEANKIKRIIDFCKKQNVRGVLWVWFNGKNNLTIKHTKTLYQPR